jgi:hypothetical protein
MPVRPNPPLHGDRGWSRRRRSGSDIAVVVSLAAVVAVAGCGGKALDLAAIKRSTRPTATEQTWRQATLAANSDHPPVPGTALASASEPLQRAVVAGGGRIVRLSFVWPAPDLVVAITEPARYLKHGLRRVTRIFGRSNDLYLAVVDRQGALVLEWSHAGTSGSLYVRHGLEQCSPVVALGWPPNLPPCPSS